MGQGRRGAAEGVRKDTAEPAEDEGGDPAVAFAALRATVEGLATGLGREMVIVRRGVEAALARSEAQDTPADYGPDLGRIVQQLGVVNGRLHAIERSPLLHGGAEAQAHAVSRTGEALVRTAVQGLERQAGLVERIGQDLAAHVRGAHDRRAQDARMWWAAGFGVILGAFLVVFVPRFLPFAADTHVAALTIGLDRVSAGQAMIRAADPYVADKVAWGAQFYDRNGLGVTACVEAARQTRKEQTCTVTVPVPAL